MKEQLSENPLLLLFVVAAIGYLIGAIKVRGASLGVAAVLFVGLAFGAAHRDYVVPEIVFQLGLVLFVYSIGLSSGEAFFKAFKKNAKRDFGFIGITLLISAVMSLIVHYLFGFTAAVTTGIYSGSSTNTTALAAVSELMVGSKRNLSDLIKGYTYAYPMGVIGVMLVLKICEKLFRVDFNSEKEALRKDYPIDTELSTRSIKVTNVSTIGIPLRDILNSHKWNIVFSRVTRQGEVSLINYGTIFQLNDTMMLVGANEDLDKAQVYFGEETAENMYYDRKEYDVQQIFVSNPKVVGRTLVSLNLNSKFDAIITRIRRGDIELLAQPDTTLEMGDRIRFVARRRDLKSLSEIFGDSYFESSKVNLFSFGLGMALGLVLGSLEVSLPGGVSFKLGYAGGPLVMGLILGALRRTGPVVWSLPYSANVTLRQLGLILLLAVVGLQSGHSFFEQSGSGDSMVIFLAGTIVCIFSAFFSVLVGFYLFKIPYSLLLGFMSNQPAILEFANDMAKNRAPAIAYTIMFPISLIGKILISQIIYLLLR